jgi:hypothetical protein
LPAPDWRWHPPTDAVARVQALALRVLERLEQGVAVPE